MGQKIMNIVQITSDKTIFIKQLGPKDELSQKQ